MESILIPNSWRFKSLDGIFDYGTGNDLLTSKYDNRFSEATIKCYAGSLTEQFAKKCNYKYSLQETISSSKIKFSKQTLYIYKGDTVALDYSITPSNTTDAIIWESSSEGIVKVNPLGEVYGIGVGSATIIATTSSGKTASINVVVSNKPTSISFSQKSKTLVVGKTYKQKAVVRDSTGIRTDIKPTYKSSNTSIATVDSKGKVKAKKKGTVTITASTAGLKAKYKIKVVKK